MSILIGNDDRQRSAGFFPRAFVLVCVLAVNGAAILDRGATDAVAAEAVAPQPWAGEQNDAVRLARQGKKASALAILQRLRREHPEDLGIARDLVVVSVWAGRDAEAIQLFTALPPGPQPDYVIEAVALAYRHVREPAKALALYRQGLGQSPNNPLFTGGEIRSMVDLGQIAPAIARAEADLRSQGERTDVLLATGYAASAQQKPVEALRYIDRALQLDPDNLEAIHNRILAINEMGAPQVARRLADANPGALSAAELRLIDGDSAAALVRWGVLEPPNEELRFAAADKAIAALDALIARWSQEGDAAARSDILRARFDRMVALRDRVRMAEVLAEYDDLQRQGVDIPGFALVAAADAYLYFRQPEKARDLFLRGLEIDPGNLEILISLVYAYVALDDFEAAYRLLDTAADEQPIWHYLKGLKDPVANPDRAIVDVLAANARLYADELAEAHRRAASIATNAPNNSHYRSTLANIYSARGWPRLAAEEYQISRALQPRNLSSETGQATNNLQLRDYHAVEAQIADLKRRFPENHEVRRLERLWQVHNMAEFRLNVERAIRAPTNAQGGSGIAIGAELYSPPIDYNWRFFGAEFVAHEQLREGEGDITLRRTAVGGEYRGRDLVASLEGTISAYGPGVETTLRSDPDEGRGGARALATWSMNDHWQIGGDVELFARDTPLRALRHGVTANAASTSIRYRESESREFFLGATAMDFSDGNLRTGINGQYTQRLITRPRFALDGILGLAESRNSADDNRPYFNPRHDALATFGLTFDQAIYRRYEFVYEHHLVVTPGVYWQQGFGTAGVASVLYEHRIRANDVLEAGVGVSFGRQSYDGDHENTTAVLFRLRQRF